MSLSHSYALLDSRQTCLGRGPRGVSSPRVGSCEGPLIPDADHGRVVQLVPATSPHRELPVPSVSSGPSK